MPPGRGVRCLLTWSGSRSDYQFTGLRREEPGNSHQNDTISKILTVGRHTYTNAKTVASPNYKGKKRDGRENIKLKDT